MTGGTFYVALLFCVIAVPCELSNNRESDNQQKKAGFLFSLPKTLVWGKNETVCLSLHAARLPTKAIIDLKWKEKHFTTVRALDSEHSCFELHVPPMEAREPQYASVHVQVSLNGNVQTAHNQDPVLVYPARPNRTFVDTDRAVYRPGEAVKFRVLVVDERFMPRDSQIPEIRIKNPLDVSVEVWQNVDLQNGLVTLEYQTVAEAMAGKWKIEVGDAIKTFDILKYVLPRFKLDLTYSRTIYYKNSMKVQACARYSHGKPLMGSVFIKITDSHDNMVPLHRIADLKEGCQEFTFSNEELNIGNIKQKFPMYDPRIHLYITVTVTEQGTNRMDVAYGRSIVLLKAYSMKFVNEQTFQPGLPYKGKIKLNNVHTDIKTDAVEICYNIAIKKSWNYLQHEQCSNFSVKEDGTLDFSLLPMRNNVIHIQLNARSLNYSNAGDSFLAVRLFSPSSSYIHLQEITNGSKECGTPQQFLVHFTTDGLSENENVTFYYMIRTLNEIQKLRKHIHTVKKTFVDFHKQLENIVGQKHRFTRSGTYVDKFTLKFKLEKEIVSKYHLLVYYVTKGGETVASTITGNFEPCIDQVEANWSQTQMMPGEIATLNIKTKSNAICSVSAVDKATKFIAKHQLTNWQTLAKAFAEEREGAQSGRKTCVVPTRRGQVGSMMYQPSNAESAQSTLDLRRRRKRHVYSFSEDFDAYDMFDKFGTITITNLKVVTKYCYIGPLLRNPNQAQFLTDQYEDDGDDQHVSIRSHFPDTWLWELVPVSGEVQLKRHLPDTITNWVTNVMCISHENGVSFANETEITGFQQFFAELLTPYSVKKGEEFHVTVHVSNYLSHKFPINITVYLSQGLKLVDSQEKLKSSHCILENSTVSRIFHLKGSTMGPANITVIAETDQQYPSACGPETIVSRKDMVFKTIQIESEGYPVKISKSAFLCASDQHYSSNVSWDMSIPNNIVPNTAKSYISLNGDLLGKTLEHLQDLLSIPTGCGEQIMASVAPNLYVLKYLNATKSLTHSVRQRIIKNLKMGYQRILNYVHRDGSFSAFGYHDIAGSMFLTTFVVRTLQEAKQYIYVDQRVIDRAIEWVFDHQLENGCFNTMLHVFQDMGGTTTENSTSALTAYVILSLYEAKIEVPTSIETNAKYCIRSQPDPDKYTLAVSCYSLFKIGWESEGNRLLKRLMAMSNQKENMLWWTKQDDHDSPATDVEITSYVLLCLLHQNTTENLAHAHGVVRWLTTKLSSSGAFKSTQDSVVALNALAKYAEIITSRKLNLSINIESVDQNHKLMFRKEDRKSKMVSVESKNNNVKINVTGEGCVLAQLTVSYYLKDVPKGDAFKLALDIAPVSNIDLCSIRSVSPCLSYNGPEEQSSMAVMEVALPSGYEADRASLYKLVENDSNSKVKMFEELKHQVNLYFNKLDREQVCFTFHINENSMVDSRKESLVKLYDYYRPELQVSQFYTMSRNCSYSYSGELPQIIDKPVEVPTINITENQIFNETEKTEFKQRKISKRSTNYEIPKKNVQQRDNATILAMQASIDFINREREFSSQLLHDASRKSTPDPYDNYEINTEVEYIGRKRRDIKNDLEQPDGKKGEAESENFNSEFVNVDVDMELPSGMEGAVPSYIMPTSGELKEIMSAAKED